MLLKEYEKLVSSPQKAEKFLLKHCWPNYQRFCPQCHFRKVQKLNSKRKCKRCGFVFTDFSQRYLDCVRLSPDNWLRLVKLFEIEASPDNIALQLDISYNTARKALTVIRLAILANSLDGPLLLSLFQLNDLISSQKTPQLNQVPILGIIEEAGHIFVDFLPEFGVDSFIHLKQNFCLPSKKIGQIIYTSPVKQYLSLLIYDQGISKRFNLSHQGENLTLDGNKSFWPFVKKRLQNFKTTSSLNFLLYFKELEFRYNYRQKDFFITLVKYLTTFKK